MVTLPGARTLVRRIADYEIDRDPVSGWRIPTFTEENITGLLIERGGDVPPFAAGILLTQDAILYTEDTVTMLDQIRDGTKIYGVAAIEEKKDSDGVLAFRACHLFKLELYQEGA